MIDLNMLRLPTHVSNPEPLMYLESEFSRPLFLDFETTGLDKGSARNQKNRIVLACWQLGWDGKLEHAWGGEYEQTALMEKVGQADYIVAHNAKFELQWLARCGLDLTKVIVYDTMLAEYVIGGNRWKTGQLSLEACLKRRGLEGKKQTVSRMIKAGICPSDIPREWLLRYCEADVRALPSLMRAQLTAMEGTRLLPVVYNRCLLTPALADLEQNGMLLDAERVLPLATELEARLAEIETEVNKQAEGVNLNSPKQLAAYLYDELKFPEPKRKIRGKWVPDRTASGGRKTDADTIAALPATTERQRKFLDVTARARDTHSQLSKYMRKFSECCTKAGGLLYGNFNQTQTFTHRLSSSGSEFKVQFQNFPRAYKRLFTAPPGYLVGETDGAQLEFRVSGHLGRDNAVVADIVDGVDVHRFTADTLTAAGQETDRQGAKEHTFKPLYGGQSGTDAEKAYYRAFREKYPGVASTQQGWVDTVLLDKKLETEWGLVYYWPDTRMDESGYVRNTTSICNYPVQAFATAEIIPIALVCMWHLLRAGGFKTYLVNTVHDSIIAYVHEEEVDAFHALAKRCMMNDVYAIVRKLYGIELIVPLGCGVKVGRHWGEAEEVKYEAAPELYTKEKAIDQRHSSEDVHPRLGRRGRNHRPPLVPAKGGQAVLPYRH
jgi:DNA polymerase I-like protein with 3'-5' exonuclease and polymerase domains